jgi:mannose-6-phosphate isomerase-like protein (cupin superfamily)
MVVRGTTRVTIGDKVQIVHENESIYMPIAFVQRTRNAALRGDL